MYTLQTPKTQIKRLFPFHSARFASVISSLHLLHPRLCDMREDCSGLGRPSWGVEKGGSGGVGRTADLRRKAQLRVARVENDVLVLEEHVAQDVEADSGA